MIKIYFHVPKERISFFVQLLAFGGKFTIESGVSLNDVLCRQLGIDKIYLDTKVQTIFVDGKSVDSIDDEIIRDGSVVALSSAMPGLAGAVFRKGGILKSLRSKVGTEKKSKDCLVSGGIITLKLFNQVAHDIGPGFLQSGICINGSDVKWFFDRNVSIIASFCDIMKIDGKTVRVEKHQSENWQGQDICLAVDSA